MKRLTALPHAYFCIACQEDADACESGEPRVIPVVQPERRNRSEALKVGVLEGGKRQCVTIL